MNTHIGELRHGAITSESPGNEMAGYSVQQLDSICQWELSLVQIKLSFLSSAGIKELKINGYLALLLQ